MTSPDQPPAYPFEVTLETNGQITLMQVPEDETAINAIVNALIQTQPFGETWAGEYRTIFVLSGAATQSVATLEDVQAITVPHWRRLVGSLRGTQLTLTTRELSDDGQTWRPYPTFEDTRAEADHPAFALTGTPVERFVTLHWREGRIDIEPDPPEDVLDLVEFVVGQFNGANDADWQARHTAFGGPASPMPQAKRATFEVRQVAPLFSPSEPPFARQSGLEFWPLLPLDYSSDGKKWQAYPVGPDQAPEGPPAGVLAQPDAALDDDDNDPFSMLSQLFDLQTATATVYADGRVEWTDGEVPDAQAEALRYSMVTATGAGQPEVWAERTGELLPEGVTGTPGAVRLQVMKALLDAAPGMLDQSFAPVALSVDGQIWHDLTPALDMSSLGHLRFDDVDEEDGAEEDEDRPDRPGPSLRA